MHMILRRILSLVDRDLLQVFLRQRERERDDAVVRVMKGNDEDWTSVKKNELLTRRKLVSIREGKGLCDRSSLHQTKLITIVCYYEIYKLCFEI